MTYKNKNRHGQVWEDVKKLNGIIQKASFFLTGSDEKEFERHFSSYLTDRGFNAELKTQTDKDTKVGSVYCFGKNNRPDLNLGEDIAIELKLVGKNHNELKEAIGQAHVYRLQYGFAFIIFIIPENQDDFYMDIAYGQETNLGGMLKYLADEMNIFSYIVPAFNVADKKKGLSGCLSFFNIA